MRMSISPDVSLLSPGDEVELTVRMANDGSAEITPILEVAGLAADLWRLANPVPVIPAGEIGETSILVRVPVDTPPGDRRISVTVRSPLDNSAASAPAALRVGAGDVLAVEASPQAVSGRKGAGLSAIVHNRGSEDLTLRIVGSSEGAAVEVKPSEFRLPAGQSTRIKARFTRAKRSWFRERKHGVVFDVRGHTVPATTTAMFVQRPSVPPVLLRSLAVLVALAVWASAVFVIFTSMAATEEVSTGTGEVVDTGPLPPPPPVVLPDPDADPAALGGQVAPPVVIQGAVEGPRNPADTVVVIERVSFGDQGTTNGTGKVAATATPVALASGTVLDKVRTTTDERGRFRVASGLRAGAFYRVSALRAGFEVRSVVVSTATSTEIDLALTLIPANGQMAGTVVDSNGDALGGVTVEATQGLITYRTVTSSSGEDTGRWTIDALATPATYLITVRQLGYASQTLTVDLEGGEALGGVDAVLTANMGTIRGQILYRDAGVGAITVNLDGDGGKRETTTLTDGPLAGNFTIPSLPYGTYLLTFTGEGWMTQSREVTVETGDVLISVRDIIPSTGIIQGIVAQQTVAGGCKYPDTTGTVSQTLAPSPCGGVGVTVVNDDGMWRTTTATSDGSFLFSNIPAGEYTVKFVRFGYLPEFYTVKLKPGDVLNLPADATYDAALASVLGGGDRGFGPLSTTQVQMRVRPAAPLDEGIIEGFIRDVTAQEIAFDDPIAGAFPTGWASLSCNGVGSPVRIVIVGAASTDCVLTAGGGYRLSNVNVGVQRLRLNIAGFDEGLVVVRVASTDISSGGVVNLMPRASVTLNLTGGSDAPVGQAIVFIGPLAVGGSTIDDSDPAVSKCAVSRSRTDVNEIWRIFDDASLSEADLVTYQESNLTRFGLCSSSDLSGDAPFPASLGPGGVDIIVPVNATDPTTSASMARTVPLDHRQLTRSLVVAAGENVRLDLRLRRYPSIVGSIQQPRESGPGFEPVDVATSGFPGIDGEGKARSSVVTFCEVDMGPLPDGVTVRPCLPFTDPKVQPRLSVGLSADLKIGQFRIDRIPPNEGNTARVFRFAISSDRGKFARDPDSGSGFENLTFGEDRALSVVMSPTPLQRIKVELRDAATTNPLFGGFLRVTGITEYRALDGPPFQEVLRLLCPGPVCVNGTPGDDGRTFSFNPASVSAVNQPFDGVAAGTYFSLGASSSSVFANTFRPGALELEVVVPGYEPLSVSRAARETVIIPDGDGTREEGAIVLDLNALPRRVQTTISATPLLANHSALTVTLTPAGVSGGTAISTQPGPGGSVVFNAVPPGAYVLAVSGPGIFPLTVGFPNGLVIVPGAGTQTLSTMNVDRQLGLTVNVSNLATPVPGAEVMISRLDGANLEDGAASRTLLTCTAAAGLGGAAGCVSSGGRLFSELRSGDYRVTVSAQGFVGTQIVSTSVTQVAQSISFNFDRFGAVTGTVLGRPSPTLQSIPLSGAQVELSLGGVQKLVSTDSDGRFTFTNLAELVSNSAYTMTVTYPGYETVVTTSVVVANNATTERDIVMDAAEGVRRGTVFDGSLPAVPLSGVTVSVIVGNAVVDTDFTGSDGTFEVSLPPKRQATIRFEQRDVAGNLLRLVVEQLETLDGGESVTANLTMAAGFSSFSGNVGLRDRIGAPTVAAVAASVTATRLNDDGITPVSYGISTSGSGDFSFNSSTRTGTYAVSVSATNYITSTPVVVLVALNGAGTVTVVLTAAPQTVTFALSSSSGDPISGVTVSASSAGQTNQAVSVSGTTVTLDALQPGAWTFVTEGGEDLGIPHLNITNGGFTVVPGSNSPTAMVHAQMTRYAKITGTVLLDAYDSSFTPPAFDWNVSNAALTAVLTGGGGAVAKAAPDAGNAFVVWVPGTGPWSISVIQDGFSAATLSSVTADFSADTAAGALTMLPAPREVVVSVDSLAITPTGPLAGLTLVATPPAQTTLSAVTAVAVEGSPGTYRFAGLVPAVWTVATQAGPSLSVPHVNATASVTVPFGPGALTLATAIIGYASFTGEVLGRLSTGSATTPLEGVTVTVTQSAQVAATMSAGSPATWTLGVIGTDAIEVSWSKAGYQTVVTTAASPVSPADVTLTAAPRPVTVTVSGAPAGLELVAELAGVTVSAVTNANGEATFVDLSIGVWSVATQNSGAVGVVGLSGAEVTVSVATSLPLDLIVPTPIYQVTPFEVTVSGADFDGASPARLAGATVTIDTNSHSFVTTSGVNGEAFAYFDAATDVTVSVTAAGYASTTSVTTSPATPLNLVLVALPRQVNVSVTSSASPSGINGLTVTATSTVSGATGAASVTTGGSGTAGFNLSPGNWTFAVSGAEALYHFNFGPAGDPSASPRSITVPTGVGAVEVGVVLRPFDATVSGTVFLVSGDDQASVSAISSEATVTATSGGLSRTATTTAGQYTLVLAGDRQWEITVAGFAASTTTSITPVSGSTVNGDVTVSASVRSIGGQLTGVGSGNTVTIAASANGFAPISQTVTGSGAYSFTGLNDTVTWTFTFSDGSVTVSRFVAPGSNVANLDQDLAAAATASVVVNLTDMASDVRTSDLVVTVTLNDLDPFPRIPGGSVTQTVTLSSSVSLSAVTFSNLVTTSGSTPFSVNVSATGYASHTREGSPGTPVEVDLVPLTRTVVLTLEKNSASVSAGSAELTQTVGGSTSTLSATMSSNIATFSNVAPGTWDLVVPNHAVFSVLVPIGSGDYSETVQLLGVATSIAFYSGSDVTTSVSVVSGSAAPTLEVRLLDAQDDIMPVTVSATLSLTPVGSAEVTVAPAPGAVQFANGVLNVDITGVEAGDVTLTIQSDGVSGSLSITVTSP